MDSNNESIKAAMEDAVNAAMECRYEQAVEFAEVAIAAIDAQDSPDTKRLWDILGVLAMVAHYGGYYALAETTYQRLLKLTNELYGNSLELAEVYADIGTLMVETERYLEGSDYLWQASEMYMGRLRGLRLQYGEVQELLAECAEGEGNLKAAVKYSEEAVGVMEGLFPSELPIHKSLHHLVALYKKLGDVDKAAEAQSRIDTIMKMEDNG